MHFAVRSTERSLVVLDPVDLFLSLSTLSSGSPDGKVSAYGNPYTVTTLCAKRVVPPACFRLSGVVPPACRRLRSVLGPGATG